MCGIAGILAFNDAFSLDEATVTRMSDTLRHRGPDDAGALVRRRGPGGPGSPPAVDHRSLVRRPSADGQRGRHGRGSRTTERSTTTLTLRAELEARGHRYRSGTDTETIVHLYEEHGVACLERLDGMFAFAIWDGPRRQAVSRARPARGQAAVLRAAGRWLCLRLGGQGASRAPRCASRPRRGGVRRLPDLRVHAAAADDVPRDRQAGARESG